MSTLVCFHAHPDDEAIATGGLMAKAAARGHRVVLVCATRGEHGEPVEGVLIEGELLGDRRSVELAQACKILGAEPPRFLGYEDSGMVGEATNTNPNAFWQADHHEAVGRLTAILEEVEADVLTIYDDHGGYGHPDHIMVHRIGKAAAEVASVANVFEATMNRDSIRAFMEMAGDDVDLDVDDDEIDVETMGTAEADISYQIDSPEFIGLKRESMLAHRSQIGPDSFFLQMPDEAFELAFGSEWFNVPGATNTGGPTAVDLLPGL